MASFKHSSTIFGKVIKKIRKYGHKSFRFIWNNLHRLNTKILAALAVLLFASIVFLFKVNYDRGSALAGWFDPFWRYRQTVTIANSTVQPLADFQVSVTLDTQSLINADKMMTSCQDIRFTNNRGDLLPYWIESGCNTSSTVIWVKVNNIPQNGTTIYIYYGNSSAQDHQSGRDTFILFDDFYNSGVGWSSGNFITENNGPFAWEVAVGYTVPATFPYFDYATANIGGTRSSVNGAGEESVVSGWWGKSLISIQSIDFDNFVVETRMKFSQVSTSGSYNDRYHAFNLGVGKDKDNYIHGQATNSTVGINITQEVAGVNTTYPLASYSFTEDVWKEVDFTFINGGNCTYSIGNSTVTTDHTGQLDTKRIFIAFGHRSPSASSNQLIDYLFVRKYAATQPTTALSNEESFANPIAYYSLNEGLNSTIHNQNSPSNDTSLVAHWKLDENTGTTTIDEVNNINGTFGSGTSAPSWVTGKVGIGLSFATNKYFTLPATELLDLQQFTISAWVKSADFNQNGFIFEKTTNGVVNTQYSCFFEANNGLVFRTYNTVPTSHSLYAPITSLVANAWNHIACSYDGKTKKIYINGVEAASLPYSQTINTNPAGTSIIGAYNGSTKGYYFNGQIDSVKVHNKGLSPTEVYQEYTDTSLTAQQNPIWVNGAQVKSTSQPLGAALSFNGSTQYLAIGNTIPLIKSLSFWINTSASNTSLIDLDGGTHTINITGSNIGTTGFTSPQIYVNGKNTSSISLNQWQHIVVTTSTAFDATALSIGKRASTYFTGSFDELYFFDATISQDQVKRLFNINSSVNLASGIGTTSPQISGLMSWYKLDEGVGTSALDSITSQSVNISNAGRVNGRLGSALRFANNAIVYKVGVTAVPPSSNITVSAWVKFDSLSADAKILGTSSANTGFRLRLDTASSANLQFYIGDGAAYHLCTKAHNLTPDTWNHVAATYNGSNFELFVNNTSIGSCTDAFTPNWGSSPFTMGGSGGTDSMVGSIDDVKVFNRVLTRNEINAEYNPNIPLLYYNFDESANTTVTNKSLQDNNMSHLIGWWKLDNPNASDPIFDDSLYNNIGTYISGASYSASCVEGYCGSFSNGSGAGVQVANEPNFDFNRTDKFSVTLWMLTSNTAATKVLFSKVNNASPYAGFQAFIYGSTGYVGFDLANVWNTDWSRIYAIKNVADNNWHHLAFINSGTGKATGLSIYIDGVLQVGVSSMDTLTSSTLNNIPFKIGTNPNAVDSFGGGIDNVKFYNTDITPDMVLDDYRNTSGHLIFSPQWQEGARANSNQSPMGKSLYFNGSEYDVVDSTFTHNGIQSVSLWIKPTSNTTPIVDFNGSNYIYIDGSNQISITGTSVTSYVNGKATSTVTPGVWQHVLLVPSSPLNVSKLVLGRYSSSFYTGSIDEFKLFNYPLTASDAKVEYNRGSSVVLGSGNNPNNPNLQVGTTSSLSGWWKFDEGTGTGFADTSGNNNNGALWGTTWIQGKFGKAISTNGSTTWASIPSSSLYNFTASQNFAVSFWTKANGGNANNNAMVEKWHSSGGGYPFVFRYNANNSISFIRYDGSNAPAVIGTIPINNNAWHHIVGYKESSTLYLYIDGILSGTAPDTTSGTTTNAYDIYLGVQGGGGAGTWYNGSLDNLKIYNRALSPAEIGFEFNQGKPLAHWKFDEKSNHYASNVSGSSASVKGLAGHFTMDQKPPFDRTRNLLSLSTIGSPTTSNLITGIKGMALQFESSKSQYAYCTDSDCANLDYKGSGLTVSAWVNAATDIGNSNRNIVTKAYWNSDTDKGGYLLYQLANSGKFIFDVRNSNGTSIGTTIASVSIGATNTWYHLVGTYGGGYPFSDNYVKIYVNGVQEDQRLYTGGISDVSQSFAVGGNPTLFQDYWNGSVDDVKIWHRPLSGAEVFQEYSAQEKAGYLRNFPLDSTQWVAGKYGNALSFDGNNDYVETDDTQLNALQNQPVSFSAWIKTSNQGAQLPILSKFDDSSKGYIFYLSSGIPALSLVGTSTNIGYSGGPDLRDGQWHHVVATYSGSAVSIYVDKKLAGSTSYSGGYIVSPYFPLKIGLYSSYFTGLLDEVKIYGYALTQDQVTIDYSNNNAIRF